MTAQDWCFAVVFAVAIGLFLLNIYLSGEIGVHKYEISIADRCIEVWKNAHNGSLARQSELMQQVSELETKLERYKNLVANLNEDVNGEVKQAY